MKRISTVGWFALKGIIDSGGPLKRKKIGSSRENIQLSVYVRWPGSRQISWQPSHPGGSSIALHVC
ncbi:hypothetical protein [Prosthecochloris sp.]|uniref:hypothetical protein n=1 Tax=Prosthecochloris sp. TaxID=290513 RepID=UPI0025F3872F|nr:hypothetical protein [Prosthecochloris sp.]